MSKKFIGLILAGVLLLQANYFNTFVANADDFDITKEPYMVDYCKDFPKNQHGQTVDVECALEQLIRIQRSSNGIKAGRADQVGYNGNHEIRIWHKDQINGFAKELESLILMRNKDAEKYEIMQRLSDVAGNFLSLNSTHEADIITKKLLANSPYFKNRRISADEIEKWKRLSLFTKEVTTDDIEKWTKDHGKNAKEYASAECNWFERFSDSLFGLCQKKVSNKLNKDFRQKEAQEEIKAEVYYLVLEQTIYSIMNNAYKGKDSLIARMDFNDDNYNSQVYFANIGLNQKIEEQDITPIKKYVAAEDSNNYSNKNTKEEL